MVDAKVMRIFFILYGGSMRLFIFRKRFCGCKNLILSELILLSDRNSSCFHGSTIIIRRRSKVDTFKFEDGTSQGGRGCTGVSEKRDIYRLGRIVIDYKYW